MEQTRWWSYVQRLMDANGWSQADLARHSGIGESVIGRWRTRGSIPRPPTVQRVAATFDRDAREALIEAGHIHPRADRLPEPADPATVDLAAVPHERLLDELSTRLSQTRPRLGPKGPRKSRRNGTNGHDQTGITTGRSVTSYRSEPLPKANQSDSETEPEPEPDVNSGR